MVTVYGARNVIFHDRPFVLLHQYVPKYVCGAQYGCFCSSLITCLPAVLLRYFLNDSVMVPIVSFMFHMRSISVVRSSYFKIISGSFLIFLSSKIASLLTDIFE